MKTPFAFRKLPAGLATLAIAALTACSSTPPQNSADTPQLLRTASQTTAQVLLLGEQHDAPSHPALHAQVLHNLAQRGQLAALALEMADAGMSTHGLPRDASESQVQQALRWNEPGWPWAHYQQAVMTAVAAGVPVLGANLPRSQMANAMKNIAAHALFSSAKWQNHLDNIRSGHCDMLPVSQIEPMARMQVQRDITMAQTLLQALPAASAAASAAPSGSASTITPPTATAHTLQPPRTVVLIAGAYHADPDLGVPVHMLRLRPDVSVQSIAWPAEPTGRDDCAPLRKPAKP